MNQNFKLQPFPDRTSGPWKELTLLGKVARTSTHLNIAFQLQGQLSNLRIPQVNPSPKRRHNLWQSTCFEFFFGEPNSPQYWEVNLSPSQDWNIYHFSNYREGMAEEARIQEFISEQYLTPSQLQVRCQLSLESLNLTGRDLELSLTAVLQKRTEAIEYWATTHTANSADFHHRQSFIVKL